MTRQILETLKISDPHKLTFSVLLSEMRIRYGGGGESDLRAGLKILEQKGLAVGEEDPITGDVRYGLTAKGRTA